MKKNITVLLRSIPTWDLENMPLDRVQKVFSNIARDFSDHTDLTVKGTGGYDGVDSLEVWGTRLENDEELNRRLEVERRERQNQEARDAKIQADKLAQEDTERQLYLKLKKKFDK